MIKRWFSGIFGFFFLRSSAAILAFALVLMLILVPFFKSQLILMVKGQSTTFANTTIAATSSNLYKQEFGDVLLYVQTVVNKTPEVRFVVISQNGGQNIFIKRDGWRVEEQKPLKLNQQTAGNIAHLYSNPFDGKEGFVYRQTIEISGFPWGEIIVGLNDDQYHYILNRYLLTVALVSLILILILVGLFYSSSKRMRDQINSISSTAMALQDGNLQAKAEENAIGEIGVLGRAINEMSSALNEKSTRLFQLAQIVEQTNDAFILFDPSLKILFVNDAITHITGYTSSLFRDKTMVECAELLNLNLDKILVELDMLSENKQQAEVRDVMLVKADKSHLAVEMRIEIIKNEVSQAQNFLIVLANISERKKLENELHKMAFYDKLTGLPNRSKFMNYLQNTIRDSYVNNKAFALFFIDLDNFKNINDTLGHEVGDTFLKLVAVRLQSIFRNNDLITRLGGDEFTVIIENINSPDFASVGFLASKLIEQLSEAPIIIEGRSLTVSASIGIARYPIDGLDYETLIKNADTAMYAAKRAGKNRFVYFDSAMNVSLHSDLLLEENLKEALLDTGQISMHFQPIINLHSHALVGAEALARWFHPEKGYISPVEFIPIAEKSNLIIKLSEYLIEIAFKQAQIWAKKHHDFYISVNISVRHFEQNAFVDFLIETLKSYKVNASNILLEFTESIMLDSTNETINKFAQLKNLGFKIAIDDFGTGYSSLGYIHKMPVDVIKIDRSFVNGMTKNKKTQAIVNAICRLSSSLEIKTIAEGIEQKEQAEVLSALHCNYGQGYMFDKPLTIDVFESKYLSDGLTSSKIA